MNAIKIDAGFKAVSQASLKIDILPSYTLHIMLSLLLDSQRPLKGNQGPNEEYDWPGWQVAAVGLARSARWLGTDWPATHPLPRRKKSGEQERTHS